MEKEVITTIHELLIDGHHLIEKKETHFHADGFGETQHVRTIDDRSYKITKGYTLVYLGNEWTEMTGEEVMQFEEDWASLWNPDIVKNEIEKFHRR